MTRSITPTTVRRLNIVRQRLAAPQPASDAGSMLDVVRDLGCLQLDPTSAVDRSHLLVLWSRLGQYERATLEQLLWQDRTLFEYWAHAASIVLTEHYPLHRSVMRREPHSSWGEWMQANEELRRHVLAELEQRGPLQLRDFEGHDLVQKSWESSGWTAGRNVDRMVNSLWTRGMVMVAGRKGATRLWDLTERVLPDWTPREELAEADVVRRAAQIAIRALGVATARQIKIHFMRNHYPDLEKILSQLESEGRIERVEIKDEGGVWPDTWYIHSDDLPLLDRLEAGDWQPRTTLLSPFDNLICDRTRTEKLFNFEFRIEIYVPKDKRKYGYFVLPILHGDRLIGRIDPIMNRKTGRLAVNNVYAEPDAPLDHATGKAVAGAIADLAAFIGAKAVDLGENVPGGWKKALQAL